MRSWSRPPLIVEIAWHVRSEKNPANPLAAELHKRLGSFRRPNATDKKHAATPEQPLYPAGVPVRFRPGYDTDDKSPPPIDANCADRTVVVVLIDATMFANRERWKDWLQTTIKTLGITGAHGDQNTIIPLASISDAEKLSDGIKEINLVSTIGMPKENIVQQVLAACIRQLSSNNKNTSKPVSVFLCHTKHGPAANSHRKQAGGETIARRLRTYLLNKTQVNVFFDRNALPHGKSVKEGIEQAIQESALLVIQTDRIGESEWCHKEIRIAHQLGRPILVIDAIDRGQDRPIQLLAGKPRIQWAIGAEAVVSALLLELLRVEFARASFEKIPRTGTEAFASAPDVFTAANLALGKNSVIAYPDPPITSEEAETLRILSAADTQWSTINEMIFLKGSRKHTLLKGRTIGLSISSVSRISSTEGNHGITHEGLGQRHIEDVFCEMARLIAAHAGRIAIGTDLRENGFTSQLMNVLLQYKPSEIPIQDILSSFLAWPIHISMNNKAIDIHRSRADIKMAPMPPNIRIRATTNKTIDRIYKTNPGSIARAFTAMRNEMTQECDARIVFGGRLEGFIGAYPGALEETYMAMKAGQPVYLLGGLGGVPKAIFDVISNHQVDPLLTLDGQEKSRPEYKRITSSVEYIDYDGIVDYLSNLGQAGLSELNGLSAEENEILARTINTADIVDIISKGLTERLRPLSEL